MFKKHVCRQCNTEGSGKRKGEPNQILGWKWWKFYVTSIVGSIVLYIDSMGNIFHLTSVQSHGVLVGTNIFGIDGNQIKTTIHKLSLGCFVNTGRPH